MEELSALFAGINSNNQEEVDSCTNRVCAAMENPQFIFFLIQNVNPQLLTANPTLYMLTLIGIKNNITKKWREEFWPPEVKQNISLTLVDLVYSIPPEQRSHIIVTLKFIIEHGFPFVSFIMQKLDAIYAQRSNNIVDMNTYFQIAFYYSKVFRNRYKAAEENGLYDEADFISNQILAKVFTILPFSIPLCATDESAGVITCSAIKILRYSLKTIDEALAQANFNQSFNSILQLIPVQSDSDSFAIIKIQVYKFLVNVNSIFLPKKKRTEIRQNFANHYQTQIIPTIIQETLNQIPFMTSYELRIKVMYIFYQFTFYQCYANSFLNQDFITNVLLRFAKLDPDDINEPIDNPYVYTKCQMNIDIYDDYSSPRTYCSMIIKYAIKRMNLIDELYPFFFSENSDPFEYEAKLYLLRSYIKYLIKVEKKRRLKAKKSQRKRLGPIVPHIREEDFQGILAQLHNNDNPVFLQVTIIALIIPIYKYMNPIQGILLAEQIMLNSQLPIVIYYGAKLFDACRKKYDDDLPTTLNVPGIINNLIPVTTIFNDTTASVISELCKIDMDHLTSFGVNIINVLFRLAYEHVVNNTNDDFFMGCDGILDNIFYIISAFNDDDPNLPQIAIASFDASTKLLSEEGFVSHEKIYEILSLINQKLDRNIPQQIDMLSFLLPHWFNLLQLESVDDPLNTVIIHDAKEICLFIYPLLTGNDRALSHFPELAQSVIQLTNQMLSLTIQSANHQFSRKNGDFSESAGYSLFLASCIIQVLGPINTTFLEAALSCLTPERMNAIDKNCTLITIMGALYVLAAYFVANPKVTIGFLNPQLTEAIISIINKDRFTIYREMVIAFIILLNFTKLGHPNAFAVAAQNVKYLVQYKREEDDPEEVEEEEEEEADDGEGKGQKGEEESYDEDDGTVAKIIVQFQVPLDSFDAIQFFKDVSAQTNLFSSLDPMLQNDILTLLK